MGFRVSGLGFSRLWRVRVAAGTISSDVHIDHGAVRHTRTAVRLTRSLVQGEIFSSTKLSAGFGDERFSFVRENQQLHQDKRTCTV